MAIRVRDILKGWFKTGMKPTEAQFADAFDSFVHKEDTLPIDKVEKLSTKLNEKYEKTNGEQCEKDIEDIKKELSGIGGDTIGAITNEEIDAIFK